jgi:hypothetical protein
VRSRDPAVLGKDAFVAAGQLAGVQRNRSDLALDNADLNPSSDQCRPSKPASDAGQARVLIVLGITARNRTTIAVLHEIPTSGVTKS